MIHSKRMLLLVLSGLLMFAGHAVSQQSDVTDRMILKNSSANGTVKGFTATKYIFQTENNGKKEIPRDKVVQVQYGDTTEPLVSLQNAFKKGKYKSVTENYGKKVRDQIKNGPLRGIHKPRVSYYMAASYFQSGSFEEASKEAQKALKQYPDQIWFDKLAQIWLLSLSFKQYNPEKNVTGDTYSSVESHTEQVIERVKSRTSAPDRLIKKLQVIRIQALEELGEGKLGVTKLKYENMSAKSDTLKNQIFAGLHRCDVRRGKKLKKALKAFKKRINETDESTLLEAGKRNVQGAIALMEWRNSEEVKQLRDALLPFLQAHLQYNEPDQLYPVQHRQSMIHTIQVYRLLAKNLDKKPSYFRKQAKKTLAELENRYPGAPETKKGKVILEDLLRKHKKDNDGGE